MSTVRESDLARSVNASLNTIARETRALSDTLFVETRTLRATLLVCSFLKEVYSIGRRREQNRRNLLSYAASLSTYSYLLVFSTCDLVWCAAWRTRSQYSIGAPPTAAPATEVEAVLLEVVLGTARAALRTAPMPWHIWRSCADPISSSPAAGAL